jgi:VanZ family protein
MQRLIDLLSRIARLAFWPALVFALVMAVLPKPPNLPIDDLGDKFAHMLAFFTLSLLAGVGWPKASLLRAALWLSVVGAGIEVVQLIPVLHRDSDWRDWVADSAAILVAMIPVTGFRWLTELGSDSGKA